MNERASRSGSVRSVNYATSPLLTSKTPMWRSRLVVALLGLAFAALLGRAAWLQLINSDFYQDQGEKRFVHKQQLPASRGRILDRNGQVLATSVALPTVQLDGQNFVADLNEKLPTPDAKRTPVPEAKRRALAAALGMNPAEFEEKASTAGRATVTLRRLLEEPQWREVQQVVREQNIPGIIELREYKRRYPEGESAAHVVGFTNVDGKGIDGIELGFERELLGRAGARTVVRDRLGRVVEEMGDQADPRNGQDVQLSIDSKVQFFAYQRVRDAVQANKAKAGSVVVLDSVTGEILALANYPSYDPANGATRKGENLRNRAITDVFEPGSTMKPLVIAQALETKRVRPEQVINTAPGSLVVGPLAVRDAHPYPSLTVEGVIQKSSNIGSSRIAMQMPARELWELFSTLGYGSKPQINFPGAVTGRLKNHKHWKPIEQATMAYGYGLSASLLQMARAYTPLARDGDVIPVTMLRQEQAATGPRVFSPETAAAVRKMLEMAAGPGGTAPKAMTPGYSVGGKSGTAHKQEGKGYASNKYRSWFVGLAPISAPRIIVAVMVDEPTNGLHYGGDVAAPVFSEVVAQTLRMMKVAPDLEVKPTINGKPLPPVAAEQESF